MNPKPVTAHTRINEMALKFQQRKMTANLRAELQRAKDARKLERLFDRAFLAKQREIY